MTNETFRLLLLCTPGIICYFLCKVLIGPRQKTNVEHILEIFVYSIISYLILSLGEGLWSLLNYGSFDSDVFEVFTGEKSLNPKIVSGAVASGVFLAIILSYVTNYNLFHRMCQKLRMTKRYGEEDVWHYFHNATDGQQIDWVIVRDYRVKLAYYGHIATWSDSGLTRELLLYDVDVYRNEDYKYLYSLQHLYLSRNAEDISIEVTPEDAETEDTEINL